MFYRQGVSKFSK